jgi:hypothetical protein
MPVIPATWAAEIRRIMVLDQPSKKLLRSHLNQKLDVVVCAYDLSYVRSLSRRIAI